MVAELRGENFCRPVAECIDAEVEEAGPGCASFCERRFECDDAVDPFLCERECTPEPDGFDVRAACARRAECAGLEDCANADGAIPDGCVDVCDGLVADCEDLFGEGRDTIYDDGAQCAVECAGARLVNGEADYLVELPMCLEDAGCDDEAIEACVEDPNNLCGDAWETVEACQAQMLFGDEAGFLRSCDDGLAMCIIDAVNQVGGPDPLFCAIALLPCLLQ